MANKIYTNHTLEEYKKKYRNRQYRLLKVTKKEVEDFHKKNPNVSKDYLLKDRKWWLIDDTYYEIPKAPRYTWFRNLNAGVQIATCALLGAGVATAVVVPTVIAINNNKSADIGVDSIDKVTYSNNGYDKDGNVKCSIKGKDGNVIESLTITIENYVLQSNEYKYNTETGEVTIYKATLDAHKGKIQITPQFKGKDPEVIKVTSVEIKNTTTSVEVDGELELSVTVLPENATNKDLDWSIKDNSDIAEIIKKDNKYYLKGKSKGSVTVTATTKDGSGKSSSKSFNVFESSSLEYVQVGETDTCLVKAKSGKTLPEDIVIPEKDPITSRTVVGIAPKGFSGTGLNVKTVTFAKSDNITIISKEAFRNNNSLVSFEIPKNVEEIGDYAFSFDQSVAGKTRSLATVTFESESKLKKIGKQAFCSQWELKSIIIPSSVEFIGQDAFYAAGLTSATFGDTTNCWLFSYSEIWTPSDAATNAKKLKDNGYFGIVKNTITISGESSVEEKKTITLSVPSGITVNEWKSSDTSKATVENGVVTGVAAGDCYIYVIAEDGTKVGIKKITVTPVKCVELDKTTLELFNGKEGTINASLSDKGTGEFSFSVTEGTDVISVTQDSSKFTIKALKKGNAKVVISCNGYASASCSVTVEELVKYKIKWDAAVNFYGKGDKKLYEYARDAKKITFTRDETAFGGAQQVGEVHTDDVRADLKNDELKIWSKGLVQFNDNDLIESSGPFNECKNLETIDLEYIDTSEMTSMNQMFSGDTSLKEIKNISSLKTAACIDMTQMFCDCNQLTSLDLSSFDTSKVNNMALMFGSTNNKMSFTELDLSSFNTSIVSNFPAMFYNCGSLKKIYASSNFVIPNGANTLSMFSECSTNLKGGKGTTWSGEHVDGAYARIDDPDNSKPGYFTDVAQKSYNIDWTTKKFGESSDESLHDLFKRAKTVEFKLDEDTTSGTLCGEEESDQVYYSFVDNELKVWSKQKIRFDDNDYPEGIPGYNAGIFSFCGAEYFDEEEGLYGATSLKLNNIDTSHVTDMSYMFNTSFCRISSIDLSSLDTSNATKMNSMFAHNNSFDTSSLSTIVGLDKFNTEKVTDMSYMFSSLNISTLDLSSFNTSKVDDFGSMFAYNGSLSTIYVSNSFEIGATATSTNMFAYNTILVGGKGTAWSDQHIDGEYARIDDPDNSKPGYFTEKK